MILNGDIVNIEYRESSIQPPNILTKTYSNYHYGSNIEFTPDVMSKYIICNGNEEEGFIVKKLNNLNLNIGFCIKKYNNEYYYQVTQHGCEMIKINITKISHSYTYPIANKIGSQIQFYY